MKRTRMWRLGLAAASLMGLGGVRAHAAVPDCLPNISGGTADPAVTVDPDDASSSWMSYLLPNVVDQQGMPKTDVNFRVRTDAANSNLYVSWKNTVPVAKTAILNPGGTATSIWVGLGQQNKSAGTLVRIDIPQAGLVFPTTVGATQANSLTGNVQYKSVSSGAVEGSYSNANWPASINITNKGGTPNLFTYSIQLQVPVSAVNVGTVSTMSTWGQIYATMPSGGQVAEYAYSTTATAWTAAHPGDAVDGGNAPGIDAWHGTFTALAASPVQECYANGGSVSVDNRFMGVNVSGNPDGFDGTVNLFGGSTNHASETLQTNDISAFVFNATPKTIPANDIITTFKVAEWGSQTNGSWVWMTQDGQLYDAASSTKKFATPNDGTAATESVALQATNTTDLVPGNQSFVDINWTPSMSYACQFKETDGVTLFSQEFNASNQCKSVANYAVDVPDPAYNTQGDALQHHQCIQAHVRSKTNLFNEITVQRNMEFGHATQFKETAKIDTKGLKAINAFGHWVYLYVETVSLDERFPDGRGHQWSYPSNNVIDARRAAATTGFKPAAFIGDWRNGFPTYIVHVYHDTGKTFRGKAVLEPQTSFGYYIAHDDGTDAYGFRHLLTPASGAGALTWQSLAPNYYRVFIPNDGAVYVTTTVQSIGSPTCSGTSATTNLATLLKGLAPFLGSSDCGKDLAKILQQVNVQCVDLFAFLNKVQAWDFGVYQGAVNDLVTELKLASGCGC